MFNSWVSADYSHRFDNLIMGVGGNFENSVFNYQGYDIADKQNYKKFDIGANVASQLAGPFSYKLGIGFARKHSKNKNY